MFTDVLANAFNSNDKKETPIQQLTVEYNFGSCKEIEACQLLLVEDVDNKKFLTGLFNAMYDELPAPKPKKKK